MSLGFYFCLLTKFAYRVIIVSKLTISILIIEVLYGKSFHYMIMVNQSLFQKKVLDALSPYKLTAGQPKVLDYLGKHNGCIQKSIATGCQIGAGNAYRHTVTHGRKKAY